MKNNKFKIEEFQLSEGLKNGLATAWISSLLSRDIFGSIS